MRYAFVFLLVLGPASQVFALPPNYCARRPGQDFCQAIAANAEAIANNAQAIEELAEAVRELGDRVASLEQAPAPQEVLRPVLVDAEGRVVGFPLGAPRPGYAVTEFPLLTFTTDGRVWLVSASEYELVTLTELTWLYAELDCQGTPYLSPAPPTLIYRVLWVPAGAPEEIKLGAVFTGSEESVEIPEVRSQWHQGYCQNYGFSGTLHAHLPEVVELTPNTPPFHFELR